MYLPFLMFPGCMSYDFFVGRELNPRVGPLDLKFFCELRPGLIGWVMLNMAFAVQAHQTGNYSIALGMVIFFQTIYVADGLFFEVTYNECTQEQSYKTSPVLYSTDVITRTTHELRLYYYNVLCSLLSYLRWTSLRKDLEPCWLLETCVGFHSCTVFRPATCWNILSTGQTGPLLALYFSGVSKLQPTPVVSFYLAFVTFFD